MRSLSLTIVLLSLMLCSCQGPKVKIVVNRLKPGMLEGKTVGVEGMMITAACWPGRYLETPVLFAAQKGLQHRLKGARTCVISESGSILKEAGHGRGVSPGRRGEAAAAGSSPGSGQPDYIFKIMLRADSTTHGIAQWSGGVNTKRMKNLRAPSYPAFGGWNGFSGDYSYPNREVTKRTLKAEYTLSDNQSCKIIWRAEAVSSQTYVEFDGTGTTYRTAETVEREVPFHPLLAAMNSAALKTIQKAHP